MALRALDVIDGTVVIWFGLAHRLDMHTQDIARYRPTYHGLHYRAWAPWPSEDLTQIDWIDGMSRMEQWLEQYVGECNKRWAWDKVDLVYQGRYVGVAFEDRRDRLLFLLRWGCQN